jgi:membrane protein required for colicin V production
MNLVDIVLVVFAVIMAYAGWRSGLVRSLGSLVALIASAVASYYTMNWIHDTFGISLTSNPWLAIISFLVIVLIFSKIAGYIVDVLDLVRKIVAILPFVNFINSALGAIFGLLQSAIVVIVLAYITVMMIPASDIRTSLLSSSIISRAVDAETSVGIL